VKPSWRSAVIVVAVATAGLADPSTSVAAGSRALVASAAGAETLLPAEGRATLVGVARAPGGIVAADAVVEIVELRRRLAVDRDGRFRFEGLAGGDYLLQARSPRWGQAISRVTVAAEGETRANIELDLSVHHEAVVVTARADARSLNELSQPVTVLSGEDLRIRDQASLGETLAEQPGVSSTGYAPGASRPVIRGLGGDRIRILEDGIGSADVSDTSPDHAVSFDPLAIEQAEVVRGPATLLYGSSAVGGVVNVLGEAIPASGGDRSLSGSLDLFGGSVADYWGGRGAIKAGKGPFVLHADVLKRKSDDYAIPGFAESEALRRAEADAGEDHEQAVGTLPNSALDSTGASVGASLVGRAGFLGASVTAFDTLFGVPGGGHSHAAHEEGEIEEHGHEGHHDHEALIRSDLRQRRLDVRGELVEPFGGFRAVKLRFGVADYEHKELEGDEVGTRFLNDACEGRLELVHEPWGAAAGSFGFQVLDRELEAIGEEAFIPPTDTNAWAVFAFEEIGRGPWKLQLGGRYESQTVDAFGEEPQSRAFGGVTVSAGTSWTGASGWNFGATLARSEKLPTAAELFSNGPHAATRAFEIGDPDLEKETSWGIDLTFGKRLGHVTGQVNLFANRFDGFIYERFTGEIEDGLDVIQFTQSDAEFRGIEVSSTIDLVHRGERHLDVELLLDYVRAELRDSGEPLPRIPPLRWSAGLHYRDTRWTGRLELRGAGEQDRISENELPTDGYTFLNASLGYRFFLRRTVMSLLLRGTNLTDAEGRNHVSYLKDTVPLPGRDVRLALRVDF
jgi:iron complex outermembrane receptor protein